jgi:hypothetical protein
MRLRHALAVFIAALAVSAGPAVRAEDQPAPAADFAAFNTSCMGATSFLLGEPPAGVDVGAVFTALCGCLATEFAPLSQADLDMLTADLNGTATKESRDAYAGYPELASKAQAGLNSCFTSDAVMPLLKPAAPADAPKQ